jgi:hypothetical protein
MKTIDTSRNGWKKQMDASMRNGEWFTLLTSNKKLADALEKGKFNVAVMNLILFGCSAAGAGVAIAGLSGPAKLAPASTLLAIADLEQITRISLALLAIVALALGCYCIYRLVKILLQKEYKFRVKKSDPFGNQWEIEGEPVDGRLRSRWGGPSGRHIRRRKLSLPRPIQKEKHAHGSF